MNWKEDIYECGCIHEVGCGYWKICRKHRPDVKKFVEHYGYAIKYKISKKEVLKK